MNIKVRKFSKEEKSVFIEHHLKEHDTKMAALSSVGKPFPNLSTQAKSLLKAGINWAKKGFPVVNEAQLNERLSMCASCEHWDKQAFKGTGRCKLCGCSTQAKLRLATEKCPIDKWGPIQTTV